MSWRGARPRGDHRLMKIACCAAFLFASTNACADSLHPPQDAAAEYARVAAIPPAAGCDGGSLLELDVEPGEGGIASAYDAATGVMRVRYPMAFNQVTEGWNWHPEARGDEDYYVFKYVPLKSVVEERPGYRGEDKIGAPQDFAVRWRYDYFFAFDNADDFYARGAADAGFGTEFAASQEDAGRLAARDLRMALDVRLAPPCTSDSTTFWKATHDKPVDFTLKKRYLMGKLESVTFYDAATGHVLARLARKP